MQILTFKLAGEIFGIEIGYVREIDRNVRYTPVPSSQDYIVGLCNIRGQIITLFDMAAILGYPHAAQDEQLNCIVLKQRGADTFGFPVTSAEDTLDVGEELFLPPPENLDDSKREFIKHVIEKQDGLLLIVDAQKLLNFCTENK